MHLQKLDWKLDKNTKLKNKQNVFFRMAAWCFECKYGQSARAMAASTTRLVTCPGASDWVDCFKDTILVKWLPLLNAANACHSMIDSIHNNDRESRFEMCVCDRCQSKQYAKQNRKQSMLLYYANKQMANLLVVLLQTRTVCCLIAMLIDLANI